MKYKRSQATGKLGVAAVERIVAQQGSIFRPVHQEDDIGIDGFIEFIEDEQPLGLMVGVQVKSGESYVASDGEGFIIRVDQAHREYWHSYPLPVLLVAYSPSLDAAVYLATDAARHQGDSIKIELRRTFDASAIGSDIVKIARTHDHRGLLIGAADQCFSTDGDERLHGLELLIRHPDSRHLRITADISRRLLDDDDERVVREALWLLGHICGIGRWWSGSALSTSSNTVSTAYVGTLVEDLDAATIRRLIALCDDEPLSGPESLIERLFDVAVHCWDEAYETCWSIAVDQTLSIERRATAFYIAMQCNEDLIEDNLDELRGSDSIGDLIRWGWDPSPE